MASFLWPFKVDLGEELQGHMVGGGTEEVQAHNSGAHWNMDKNGMNGVLSEC